jgi:broad specificity phosphatase PhoE
VRLILVRHGETETNRQRLALGRDDAPPNEKGRRQATAVAAALTDIPIDAVHSSPLRRALEPAQAIAAAHGLTVQVEDGLTEMDVGEMEGLAAAEMRARYGEFLRRWFSAEAGELAMPGGESLQQVQDRAWEVVLSLQRAHPDGTVVAVSHNFTIHTILCRALDLPLASFRRLRHDLAAIAVIDLRDEGTTVVRLNDTCHLEAESLAERGGYWAT